MKPKGRLKNVDVQEVSLVDAGANNRKYAILKSRKGESTIMQTRTKKSLSSDKKGLASFLKDLFKGEVFEDTQDKIGKDDPDYIEGAGELEMADGSKMSSEDMVKTLKKLIGDHLDKTKAARRKAADEDMEEDMSMSKEDEELEMEDEEKADEDEKEAKKAFNEDVDGETKTPDMVEKDENISEFFEEVMEKLNALLLHETEEEQQDEDQINEIDGGTDYLQENLAMSKSGALTKAKESRIVKSQAAIIKSQNDEIKKANSKIEILMKEREQARTKEFIQKAAAYRNLGIEKSFGKVLKSLFDTNKEAYEAVSQALNNASEAVSKSSMMDEIGTGASEEGSNSANELEGMIGEIMKSHKEMTREQAIEKAVCENPRIYDEFRPRGKR